MVRRLRSCPRGLSLWALLGGACTVDGEDGATSLGGTTVPGTSVTTTVGTTVASTSVSSTSTSDDQTTSDDETSAGSGPEATTDPTAEDDTNASGTGPDEQPADGLYSACVDVTECFGATVCVLVMGNLGYCSTNCAIPSDCDPSPAGTATPACVVGSVNGTDMQVCALDCSGGKTCPGGMECLALGASMVCV